MVNWPHHSTQVRKKLFGIALLLALLVPVPATVLWLEIQREAIHEEVKVHMEQNFSEDELVQISVSKNESHVLQWKNQREFVYQSTMYDVVRRVKKGEQCIYYCFPDRKETQLEARINKALSTLYGKEIPGQQNELQLIYLLQILDLPPVFTYSLHEALAPEQFFGFNAQLSEIIHLLDSPPPQTI